MLGYMSFGRSVEGNVILFIGLRYIIKACWKFKYFICCLYGI